MTGPGSKTVRASTHHMTRSSPSASQPVFSPVRGGGRAIMAPPHGAGGQVWMFRAASLSLLSAPLCTLPSCPPIFSEGEGGEGASVSDEVSEEAARPADKASVFKGSAVCLLLAGGGRRRLRVGPGHFPSPAQPHRLPPSDLLPGMEEMTQSRREGLSGECGLTWTCAFENVCVTKLLAKASDEPCAHPELWSPHAPRCPPPT